MSTREKHALLFDLGRRGCCTLPSDNELADMWYSLTKEARDGLLMAFERDYESAHGKGKR